MRIAVQSCVRMRRCPRSANGFLDDLEGRYGAPVALGASGRKIMRVQLMVSTLLAFTVVSASGDEQLRIAVSPAQSFAPSDLRIRARVAPHAENRSLEIVAESSAFYRSSQISLEGERAAATNMFEFRGLPGGEYLI